MAIILDARLALDERHGEVAELTEYIGDRADEREPRIVRHIAEPLLSSIASALPMGPPKPPAQVLCGLTCGAILRLPNHMPKYMDSASPAKAMKNGART